MVPSARSRKTFPLREGASPRFTENIGQWQSGGNGESRENQAAKFGGESLLVSFSFGSPDGNCFGHCHRRFSGLSRNLRGQRLKRVPAEAQSAPHAAAGDSATAAAE